MDLPFRHRLHVVFQVLGVGGHNGAAVVILGILVLLVFVEHTGVENGGDSLVDEPLDVAVGQLGRVALRLRRNGVHALFVDLPVREGGQHRPDTQVPEEGSPEGVILIHIQHSGESHSAPGSLLLRQRLVGEHPLLLEGHHVGGLLPLVGSSPALLAAVAGDVPPAPGEDIDGEHTVVGAAAAADSLGGIGQVDDVLQGQHGGALSLVVAAGNEGRAESAHEPRDIRADDLRSGNGFEGPKHRLIVEGAALDHNMAAQLLGGAQLDDLKQGVFDDGIGKPRGNIGDLGSFLLSLLHVGIHEYGAAGAQVHGILGKQGLFGKALRRIAQGIGEVFNKGAAAGGAGLVEHDGVHRPVFQADALHVLAADVQHAVYLGVKEAGGGAVGDGLHLSLVQGEGGLQEGLAVARGAGPGDPGGARKHGFQVPDGGLGRLDGISLVVGVEGIQQLPFLADEGQLGGGGSGIDA